MAHSLSKASFSSPAIKNRCNSLQLGERLYLPPHLPFMELAPGQQGLPEDPEEVGVELPIIQLYSPEIADARTRYKETIMALVRVLAARLAQVERRRPPDEFHLAEQPNDVVLTKLKALRKQLAVAQTKAVKLGQEVNGDPDADKKLAILERVGEYTSEVIRRSRAQSKS